MRTTVLLTDSACDLSPELEKEYGIDILPFHITVDGVGYTERVDFDCEQYYDMLTKCKEIPKTAQITSFRYLEKFEEYAENGVKNVICVTINSGGSNTHQSALMARDEFAAEHPESDMHIYVVDSHSYSMVYGDALIEAAKKIDGGADVKSVIDFLKEHFACAEVVLSMYTLNFAKKSGRISAAAAFAGELLGLKPIITIIDGVTKTASKVRGDNAVMPAIVAHAQKNMEPGSEYIVGTTDKDNGKMLSSLCKKAFGYPPKRVFLLGAAVATNTGPNAVAMVYRGKPRR